MNGFGNKQKNNLGSHDEIDQNHSWPCVGRAGWRSGSTLPVTHSTAAGAEGQGVQQTLDTGIAELNTIVAAITPAKDSRQ